MLDVALQSRRPRLPDESPEAPPIGITSENIVVDDPAEARKLLGQRDKHLRLIRDVLDVQIVMRGGVLRVKGEERQVAKAAQLLEALLDRIRRDGALLSSDVENAIAGAARSDSSQGSEEEVDVLMPGRPISAKSPGQANYLKAIRHSDLVLAIGPAGTGKTYLAVAKAVSALKHRRVRKIVLARPAVEAGERLGFLPGDMQAKVNPYLRPLYDALQDMIPRDKLRKFADSDIVEVVPLAYMRGRTLDNSFIILDEAQNCTCGQMKMFLTRLGVGSRCVVTGDVSQVDLPVRESSGLTEAIKILKGLRGMTVITLTQDDIVGHRLVQDIVDAYERHESRSGGRRERPGQDA